MTILKVIAAIALALLWSIIMLKANDVETLPWSFLRWLLAAALAQAVTMAWLCAK